MRGSFLSVSVENADFLLPTAIAHLATGRLLHPSDVHQVCTLFRQRGLAQMLLEGQARAWHLAAMRSAGAFVHGLDTWPRTTQVNSFATPLFDALAAGYWEAARAIAVRSRTDPNPDWEYVEDFLYVRFIFEFHLAGEFEAAAMTLEHYARVLDGPADARLEVCRALLESDAVSFDEGLVRLLDERDERVRGWIAKATIGPDAARWLAHVSVEGLALLAIARHSGLKLAADYLHCPAIARAPSPLPYDSDAWRNLHW